MHLYRLLIRPLLFRLDAEFAHQAKVEVCRWLGAIPGIPSLSRTLLEVRDPALQTEVAGLRFSNPVGLAAGWDKNGRALRMLNSLGFGHAEIGSVSARASVGNPGPRLFRLPQDRAIIVNYGLPNDGALAVAARLQSCPSGKPAKPEFCRWRWEPRFSCWSGVSDDAVTDSREQAQSVSSMPSPYFSAASSRSQRSRS